MKLPSYESALSFTAPLAVASVLFLAAAGVEDLTTLRERAAKGDAEAELVLGRAYLNGNGVAKDDAKAFEYFQKAAAQSEPKAQHNLGLMYLQGRGTEKSEVKGIEWLRKAAAQGSPVSQDALGLALRDGSEEVRDLKGAANAFRGAAEKGYLDAQVHLGRLYYFGGPGFEKDYDQAAFWLKKAASRNQMWAQNTLGAMYETGQGVAVDRVKACELFRKAAEQGDARAQANIGRMYMTGSGIERDLVQAYRWLRLGTSKGDTPARNALADLRGSLTPSQLEEGDRLVAAFRPRQSAQPSPSP